MRRRLLLALILFATPIAAAAQPVSQIFAFGNSWVDISNLGPASNGPLQIQYAASLLGVPVTSYGYVGAANGPIGSPPPVPHHLEQIETFVSGLGGAPADADALYLLWPSGFDLQAAPGRPATLLERLDLAESHIREALHELYDAGARRIFVATPTPARLNPGAPSSLNARINALVPDENASLAGADIEVFDAYSLMLHMIQNPATYGFTQVQAQCNLDPLCVGDPTVAVSYVYWDFTHGTTRVHELLGQAMVAQLTAIPEPETYVLLLAGLLLIGVRARKAIRALTPV